MSHSRDLSHTPHLRSAVVCIFSAIVALFASPLRADHPDAEKLLPEKTVVFAKIDNVKDFVAGFSETSFMKMLKDENVAPVVESLYGSAEEAYASVEEGLGVSLQELQTLLNGEICLALVAEKDEPLKIVAFADYKGNEETANKLLDLGEGSAVDDGAKVETLDVGEITIRSVDGGDDDRQVHYFQKNDSVCVSNDLEMVKLVLARWMLEDGEELSTEFAEELAEKLEKRTFNKNRKFLNVMKQCDGDEDYPPQARLFVDPYELIKATQSGSGVVGTALVGILRGLGVDGLLGIGASLTTTHDEFDSILHVHVGLANPRAGIIKMLAIEPADLTPEPIFSANVANYFTTNLNSITSYNEVEKIYDLFNGEEALNEALQENFTERFGVDLKEDILESLEGRISFGQMTVDSGALNGQAVVIAAKLKDANAFEDVFADLRDGIEELADRAIFTPEKYKGVEYFVLPGPPTQEEMEERRAARRARNEENGRPNAEERPRRAQFGVRRPIPCIGIVGDYLVFSDAVDFMRDAIKNEKNPDSILADDPDYKKLLREINRQLDGKKPALITFQRPAETFRMLFDAVKNDDTKNAISERSEDNPFFGAMQKAFIDNELPDFDDLEKYFVPAAGVMTNDETGFHYMTFSQKADLDE